MDIDYPNIKDWHGRPAYVFDDKKGWVDANYKDCKKSGGSYTNNKGKDTPFVQKDVVWVDGMSTINKKKLLGWFHFDSWDSYDDTFYVGDSPMRIFNYNVPMGAVYHPDSREYRDYLDKTI